MDFIFIFYSILTLICSLHFTSSREAKMIDYELNITYIHGSPDGVYKEKIFGINGNFPGPTIEAEIGDTLRIKVINSIGDGQDVSIHWHGIHHKMSQFEDGATQISQCPLPSGQYQIYQFKLYQAGTFWYHSHHTVQYSDGLWGALIIHNKSEVYTYDEDIIITLNDWYHRPSHESMDWFISRSAIAETPYPDSAMINGLGRYPCPLALTQNRSCDLSLQKRPLIPIKEGKTYRFRVINTSSAAAFNFSIDSHRLGTIEVDGSDLRQVVWVDMAVIAAGQRYSFLVTSNSSSNPDGRYLIRGEVRKDLLITNLSPNVNINKFTQGLIKDVTAVLQYTNDDGLLAPTTEPFSYEDVPPKFIELDQTLIYLEEEMMDPLSGFGKDYHKEVVLEITFFEDLHEVRHAGINGHIFQLPTNAKKPLLMQLLEEDVVTSTNNLVVELNYGETVQVVINNPFVGPHPFHLHGYHFSVVGKGKPGDGSYNKEKYNRTLKYRGVKRDTVVVEHESWVVIRFVADNPGVWLFHCHIDWHNLSGMAMLFIVGKDMFRNLTKIPEEASRVCALHLNTTQDKREERGMVGVFSLLQVAVIVLVTLGFLIHAVFSSKFNTSQSRYKGDNNNIIASNSKKNYYKN